MIHLILNRIFKRPTEATDGPEAKNAHSSTNGASTATLERHTAEPATGASTKSHTDTPETRGQSDPHRTEERSTRSRRRRSRGKSKRTGQQHAGTANNPAAAYDGPLPEAFKGFGLDETGLRAIGALGFDQPTPIQEQAIPFLLEGRDVVGLAQTGTGKTLAFGLPLARSIDIESDHVQALVLVPTRELANQVFETIEHLAGFYGYHAASLVGGRRINADFQRLEQRPQVIVGTPGRVIDHMKRGTLDLSNINFLVLDEADQMFDIGFARDIDYIIRKTPTIRLSALFSATMPPEIARLVQKYMKNAETVSVSQGQKPAEGVKQYYCEVSEREKFYAMRYLYETRGLGRSLVFRRTRAGVDRLARSLHDAGLSVRAIHGDLRQGERDRVMADFRNGRIEFLIATNVAARGIDIPDIEHVINYDVPQNPEEYIHRVGRTARAGKTGSSVTFVGEWEVDEWDRITRSLKDSPEPEYLDLPTRWD